MDVTVKELPHSDVIALKGRLERSSVALLTQALDDCNQRGRYKIIVDMHQVEYMSSAGFRALLTAQRNSQRNGRGELILAQVPDHISQVLELTGMTQLFRTFADLPSAVEFAAQLPEDPTTDAPPPEDEKREGM